MGQPELNRKDLESYLKAVGPDRFNRSLTVMANCKDFAEVFGSPMGRVLFMDGMEKMEEIISKISDGNETAEERMELKILKQILNRWSARALLFLHKVDEIKTEAAAYDQANEEEVL